MDRFQRRSAPLLLLLSLVACVSEGPAAPDDSTPVVRSVTIWPRALYLAVPEDSSRLSAVALDERGMEVPGTTFTWATSDAGVVTVDATGLVRGVGLGTALVTAGAGAATGSVEAEVDPVHSVARSCGPCHTRLEGDHAALLFPLGACWGCHAVAGGAHGPTDRAHAVASGGFTLVGVHDGLACTACHGARGGGLAEIAGTPEACAACHEADAPAGHATAGFAAQCSVCHAPTSWVEHVFDHAAFSGGFVLSGPHEALRCLMCHDLATYETHHDPAGPDDCFACHAALYVWRHGGSGYPTTCLLCHDGQTWEGASVLHTELSAGFALLGVHETLPCAACHDSATFAPLYHPASAVDCVACHREDYDATHADSGYPFTCPSCHTPSSWEDAVFDHDAQYFPIFTGEHRSRWETGGCATCHPSQSDFGDFTCFACHRHAEAHTTADHAGVAGYVYESAACVRCHPDGSA